MFCRFFKIMISHAADVDKPLDGMTRRHIQRCRSCKRFYEICHWLGDGLRAEAADLNCTYELLTEQITDSLANPSKRSRHVPFRLKYFAVAACIALAATASIIFMLKPPRPRILKELTMPISDLLETDLSATWAVIVEEPLAGEMKNLADNTESVIHFLVACVDVDPLQNGITYQQFQ